MVSLPISVLNSHLEQAPEHSRKRLAFMSADHHKVRYYLVRELARAGRAIYPGEISESLDLQESTVVNILDDLEAHLFFLVRNERGAVNWAFPVTVEKTPHKLTFSTGEQLFAA